MNHNFTRRTFLIYARRLLVVSGAAALLAPVIAYFYPTKLEEMPSEPVLVGPEKDLAVGQSKTVHFGRYPALVINTTAGLRAYSAVCPHFACIVKWDASRGHIACPCHEGFFDPTDGHVLSGPPPVPLTTLALNIVDGNIYVGGAS